MAYRNMLRKTGLYRPIVSSIQLERKLRRWSMSPWQKRKMSKFYAQFISQYDIVFNIGAYKGKRTEVFCKLGACVIAIEPQPKYAKRLRAKFKDALVVQKAVASYECERTMILNSRYNELSSLSTAWLNQCVACSRVHPGDIQQSIKVQTTTLDQLIREYGKPSFVKIDVEGLEDEVIAGLTQPVNALSWEFQSLFLKPALSALAMLEGLGYKDFNYSVGESMEFAYPGWVRGNNIRLAMTKLGKNVFGDIYARY